MRKIFSLDDDRWFVGGIAQKSFADVNDFAEVDGWLPANVPGDVRLDLIRAGKIPDPFLGDNHRASQWVDDWDWWYRREIELPQDAEARTFLIFEGIDYQSAVFWNGTQLGRHMGMFSRQVYEIPNELMAPRAQLAVRVWGAGALPRMQLTLMERLQQFLAARTLPYPPIFPDRLATLKCQMSFGWDFAPRLRACGIWEEAWIVQTRDVFIRDLRVQAVPDGRISLKIELDAERDLALKASARVRPKNFEGESEQFEFDLEARHNRREYAFQFQLHAPRLWNPWDRGEPNLYELDLTLHDDAGVLDIGGTTFGIRTIELVPNPGSAATDAPWTFVVNGIPEFIRGANWVPADAIPARVTRDDYDTLLGLARAANINLLRVWGGGLREKRAFYDLCDERGLLLWQEFPFSVAQLDHFPRDDSYRRFAEAECSAIVSTLRNHPALVMWCGGNEFNPSANERLVETMRNSVAAHDGTRPFKPASPSPGESHNWKVWHGRANTRDYRKDNANFFGEFGLQSPPSVETLARFIPPEDLWPPGPTWVVHNAELEKIWRYARSTNHQIHALEEFVGASQRAQLRGMQLLIEHARRNKPRVSGCAFWQFNEPWPAICWSVLDYFRQPKSAYYKIKELYNPVLISFDYPLAARAAGDEVAGDIWLINDTLSAVRGEVCACLNETEVLRIPAEIGPNASARVGALSVCLGVGENALRIELAGNSEILATNEYDLNYLDRGDIGWVDARLSEIGAWLMNSQ